jgi:hypothetical protein
MTPASPPGPVALSISLAGLLLACSQLVNGHGDGEVRARDEQLASAFCRHFTDLR